MRSPHLATPSPLLWLLSMLLAPALASATPVDATDPTPRPIEVLLEASSCDPAAPDLAAEYASCTTFAGDPGAVFGTSLPATFSVSAGVATVTIAGSDWESILFADQGMSVSGSAGIVPGTTSDAVLAFDVASGAPLSWGWTSTLVIPVFFVPVPLTGAIAPVPNDVYFTSFFGTPLALNCVGSGGPAPGGGDCTGPGHGHVAYDPATGSITALGAVANGIVREAWAPADWRLLEVAGASVTEPHAMALLGSLGLALLGRPRR